MTNTYTQLHHHIVFAVQNRQCLIDFVWEEQLYKYINGIIRNYNHKVLAINGMPDHIHILIGQRPDQALSELIQFIKKDSTKWINMNEFVGSRFSWQEGFGAFSYAKSDLNKVIDYIKNQKAHHNSTTFIDEYVRFLKEFQIDYDDRYIFHSVI